MEEFYCENCESFSVDKTCQCCGLEFIEPDWSVMQAIKQREELAEASNFKLI
jgi:RNA polymerase subunit RPABC4/transcription elongation factor Spt4